MKYDTRRMVCIGILAVSCVIVNNYRKSEENRLASSERVYEDCSFKYSSYKINDQYYVVKRNEVKIAGSSAIGLKSYNYLVDKVNNKIYILMNDKQYLLKASIDNFLNRPIPSKDESCYYISLYEYNNIIDSTNDKSTVLVKR